MSHYGGELEAVPTQSSTGSNAFKVSNLTYMNQQVSNTSSSDPRKGYNDSTLRGFRADVYPEPGVGRPPGTPSTGSSQRSLIDAVGSIGYPQTAEDYRSAVKASKNLSTPAAPIQGQPFYERDQYYTPNGMHDYRSYKEADTERKIISKAAAAATKAAPLPRSRDHDPEPSRFPRLLVYSCSHIRTLELLNLV